MTRTTVSMASSYTYSSETLAETATEITFSMWVYVDSVSLQSTSYIFADDQPGGYFFFFYWNAGYNGF